MSERLDAVRKALQSDARHVAIITAYIGHWKCAKQFVMEILGHPHYVDIDLWYYPDGKTIRFYTTEDGGFHMYRPDPYRAEWIFFGPEQCDELLGVDRRYAGNSSF